MANEIIYTAARAQDINSVTKFVSDLHNLLTILGQTDVQMLPPGAAFKIYPTRGTLSTATVAEKASIPDSGIVVGTPTVVELGFKKYRNLTGIESIQKYGYDVAVGKTNDAMLRLVQKGIRKSIFDGIATGTGTATGTTFQAAIAAAAAQIEVAFEDEAATPVFFANPTDAYGYLGTHNVTLENSFGLSYLANFMGIGNVIIDSNVTAGTVIGTAAENICVVSAELSEIPGMDLYIDESGIVGVHNGAKYENAAIETVIYSGLSVLPIFLDRIVKSTISTGTD